MSQTPAATATATPATVAAATTATAAATDAAATPAGTPAPAEAKTPATMEELTAELATWKGHARTWETRAGENKTAKDALDKIEADKLTETQRLEKERDDARAELATSKTEAMRNGVATAKGVPLALLSGTTKEELEASADALIAFRGNVPAPTNDAAASGTQGTTFTPGAQITSRAELASMSPAEIVAARKDGRLKTLLGA